MTIQLETRQQYIDFLSRFDTFLFDCDGVIWHGNDMIPNVKSVLSQLVATGKRIMFVTNNSSKSRKTYLKKFEALGIDTTIDHIFGSSYCAAYYMANDLKFPKDRKVYVFGSRGVTDELDEVGLKWVGSNLDAENITDVSEMSNVDLEEGVGAVLVGFDLDMNYKKLGKAHQHLMNPDTIFLATNDDKTFPVRKAIVLALISM